MSIFSVLVYINLFLETVEKSKESKKKEKSQDVEKTERSCDIQNTVTNEKYVVFFCFICSMKFFYFPKYLT